MTKNIDLLTVPEAAKVLRISSVGLRRIIASGDLRYFKVRGSVRINRDDIVVYLNTVAKSELDSKRQHAQMRM